MKRTKLTPSSLSTTKLLTTPSNNNNNNGDENQRPMSTPRNPTRTKAPTYKCIKSKSSCQITNHKSNENELMDETLIRTPLSTNSRVNKGQNNNVQSNNGNKTPSTPKRCFTSANSVGQQRTPSTTTKRQQHRQTPIKAKHSLFVEFSDDIFLNRFNKDSLNDDDIDDDAAAATSLSVRSLVKIDTMPIDNNGVSPNHLNRSHSASSLRQYTTNSCSSSTTARGHQLKRSRSEARLASTPNHLHHQQNVSTSSWASTDGSGEASQLTVGVRVRPLQAREHGNAVFVNDDKEVSVASDLGSVHKFTYDHCFNTSAQQTDVFETMVRPLLDTAFLGYNACLLAYGQTGSGKTYSMMGPLVENHNLNEQSGIIPRFCCELLKQISQLNTDEVGNDPNIQTTTTTTTVEISYLEVYNEKIHDLLVPKSQTLRVREHPLFGPYVVDLTRHTVNTVEDFQKWLNYGNKRRATAATEMNDNSSRSHTLFTVIFTQTFQTKNNDILIPEQTRTSQINLVDLAGSERISHSIASSDRIREGVSINRSLLTLGKVISALIDKRGFVPYRESVLTWLLKESLGGNSRTSMLATISPCSSHVEETLSTLRYASQARSIVNTVRVNEGPQDKIIRELRAEVERLNLEMKNNKEEKTAALQNNNDENNDNIDNENDNKHEVECDRLKHELIDNKYQLEMIEKELLRYQQEYENLTKEKQELSQELFEKTKKIDEFKLQVDKVNKELKPLQGLLTATQIELKENSMKINQLNDEKINFKMENQQFQNKLEELNKQFKFNEKEKENYQILLKEKEKENENLMKNNLELSEKIENLQKNIDNHFLMSKSEKEKLDENLYDRELKIDKLNKELSKKGENEMKMLENIQTIKEKLKNEQNHVKTLNDKMLKLENQIQQMKITELNSGKSIDLEKQRSIKIETENLQLNKQLMEINENFKELQKKSMENLSKLSENSIEINKLKLENDTLKENLKKYQLEMENSKDNQLETIGKVTNENKRLKLEMEKLEKQKNDSIKVIDEKIIKISQLNEDNELLKKQQANTRDELLKNISVLNEKSRKIQLIEKENKNLLEQMKNLKIDFNQYKQMESVDKEKLLKEKQEQINKLIINYENSMKVEENLKLELNNLKLDTETKISMKNDEIYLLKNQMDILQTQLKKTQQLYDELMQEKLAIVKIMEKQCLDKENRENLQKLSMENSNLKHDLGCMKEKLTKKIDKIDRLKVKIIDLENLLKKVVHDKILYNEKEAELKRLSIMKDNEIYNFIMDNLYPHHWQHLLRKARNFTEKFRIPYEFELDQDCVIVKHLMLSASTKLTHFQFNLWLNKLEKNQCWLSDLDKEWNWRIDLNIEKISINTNQGTNDDDKINDNKSINIGIYKTKNDFIDPIIWHDTILRRHVRGIREDVDALIVHFSSSEDSLIYSILSRLKTVADRLEEVTINKKITK